MRAGGSPGRGGAAGGRVGLVTGGYALRRLRRRRETALQPPQPCVYTPDPAAPGQRLPRRIPHLLPRGEGRKKKNQTSSSHNSPSSFSSPAPGGRLHLGTPPSRPQVRSPRLSPAGDCACSPAAGARPRPPWAGAPPCGAGAVAALWRRSAAALPRPRRWPLARRRGRCQEPPWPRPLPPV